MREKTWTNPDGLIPRLYVDLCLLAKFYLSKVAPRENMVQKSGRANSSAVCGFCLLTLWRAVVLKASCFTFWRLIISGLGGYFGVNGSCVHERADPLVQASAIPSVCALLYEFRVNLGQVDVLVGT